jgi:hypothetical protein
MVTVNCSRAISASAGGWHRRKGFVVRMRKEESRNATWAVEQAGGADGCKAENLAGGEGR